MKLWKSSIAPVAKAVERTVAAIEMNIRFIVDRLVLPHADKLFKYLPVRIDEAPRNGSHEEKGTNEKQSCIPD